MRKLRSEGTLSVVTLIIIVVISIINPRFLTLSNFIDMIRSSITTGIFAIGAMLVLISGGIDVSFPAIAAFSMYSTTKLLNHLDYQGGILIPFLIAIGIGIVLGAFNAALIHVAKISTFIATIGTQNVFSGILLTFIGANAIMKMPPGYTAFAKNNLLEVKGEVGVSSLPLSLLILLFIGIVVYLLLHHTMLGRGIFAIGGNMISAQRVGFSVGKIQLFLYCFVGAISGAGGLIHTALMRTSNPFDLLGGELTVIAAVVLGGTSIKGGKGTIRGTLLGVFVITLISNSLILLGIPTYWQRMVLGFLIVVSIALTTLQQKGSSKKRNIYKEGVSEVG